MLYIGIDLGTSGCRAIAIDEHATLQAESRAPLPTPVRSDQQAEQNPGIWWQGVCDTLTQLISQIDARQIQGLAVDGTSGTLLLADKQGEPLGPALMYNDARSQAEAIQISQIAPQESAAHGATSALAKLLHMKPDQNAAYALHQADWIVGKLTGRWGVSDTNNCLKLGYDAFQQCWPNWLDKLAVRHSLLPNVYTPGQVIGSISATIAKLFGLPKKLQVIAGTTDSTAAIIATGAKEAGDAVTSLGSTLVMKVVSDQAIFSPEYGIYSQPLGKKWLVGGGSNSGGAVLLKYFSQSQMAEMSAKLKPEQNTGLNYYPLLTPGERFPIADPLLQPHLSPRPASDIAFFQAMLEGMSRIEQQAYQRLAELGAPYPSSVRSAGGGAKNSAWTTMRENLLGVPFVAAKQQEAAYGAALLARQGCLTHV